MNTFKKNAFCSAIALTSIISSSVALGITSKQCKLEANTELEKIYCQVLEKGAGGSLPSFGDFQRNSSNTQKLILLGPARKLGITIPNVTHSQKKPNASPIVRPQTNNQNAKKNQPSIRAENRQRVPETDARASELDACELRTNQIICPRQSYFLVINIPINRLPQKTLEDMNTLSIRKKFSNESTLQYLSDVYPYYVEKMLLIGLGDSTVSFTKFNAIYDESLKQKESFSDRFGKMYELLKKERKTMSVKTRYRNNFPEDISQCMQLSQSLVACDNIEQNWVYQKLIRQ